MDDLKALFDHVAEKTPDFTRVELEKGDIKLVVERGFAAAPAVMPIAPQTLFTQTAPAAPGQAAPAVPDSPAPGGTLIKSPIVGTFYSAPSPDAPPFVSVGHKVKKGQVLCVIEAMKMMNEIESETDGVISRILVENGDLVEFGQALFEIV